MKFIVRFPLWLRLWLAIRHWRTIDLRYVDKALHDKLTLKALLWDSVKGWWTWKFRTPATQVPKTPCQAGPPVDNMELRKEQWKAFRKLTDEPKIWECKPQTEFIRICREKNQ